MKIVVTSDTHLPTKNKRRLPNRLIQELVTTDFIVHAGDWSSKVVYDELQAYAPVKGVYGNADDESITAIFPFKEMLDMKGYKIGITHGHGEKKTTEKRVLETFLDDEPDVIIFGHSHIPLLRYFKKTLLVNPGSPIYKRQLPYYSFVILEIEEELRSEVVFFS